MENSYIEDDKLIRYIPVMTNNIMTKAKATVITKEEFLMCYKAWVEGKEESNDGRN